MSEPQSPKPESKVHLAQEHAALLPLTLFEFGFDPSETRDELKRKIAWIIRIRFLVNPTVFVLMFLAHWQWITHRSPAVSGETLWSTGLTTGISIVLNVIYQISLRRPGVRLRKFVFLQLALDVLLFTAYVWRTGGVTSPFSFLYFLPILGAAMLLSSGAGMVLAGLSAAAYLGVVLGETWGSLPHVSYFMALDRLTHRTSYVMLMIVVNLFAFFTVAGVSGFFMRTIWAKTRELREANVRLEHKAKLFQMLHKVSELLQQRETADEVLDGICDILVTGLQVDRALVYLEDGPQLRLHRVVYHQRVPESAHTAMRVAIPLDPAEGLTARCAVENRAFNVIDPAKQEGINAELAHRIGMNPFALAPMSHHGKVMGVIGIDRSEGFGTISEDEFHVLKAFARQAAQTLAAAHQR